MKMAIIGVSILFLWIYKQVKSLINEYLTHTNHPRILKNLLREKTFATKVTSSSLPVMTNALITSH